jgi:hypothetical protein
MADWYGTFSADSRYSLHVQAYESATYVATNESDVVVNAWVEKASGGGYFTSNTNATASLTVNGVGVGVGNWSPYDFSSYTSKLLISTTRRIAHNADGTKTVAIAMSANDPNNFASASIGTVNLALTTLPRASVPTLSASTVDVNGSNSVTINMNAASSSFRHEIEYDFVSLTGQTTGLGSASIAAGVTSTTLTPPTSILSQIPNGVSGTLVVRVKTYNVATLIGTNTVNLTVTVPTAAVPTVGTLTVAEGTVVPDVATLIGKYVQNVSKITATASTINGIYGSTIVSTKITVDGQTITGTSGTTVNPLASSGTYNVVAETTDSRGRVGTTSQSITVLPYAVPSVSSDPLKPTDARRALVSGTVDQSAGTYIRIDMAAVVQSLINGTQKNLLQYRVSTSPAGANTWTVRKAATSVGASTLAFDSYGGSNPYILLTTGAPYSITAPFDVKIEIIDKLSITQIIRTVAQGALLADWNAGLGLGLGAYHQGLGRLETTGGGGIYQDGLPVVDFGDLATTSLPGIQRDATGAEVITGSAGDRTVTPLALQSLTATDTRRGLVELATPAEVLTGTDTDRAITPAGLATIIGLIKRKPTSASVGGGTAPVISSNGRVTFTSITGGVKLNGVFRSGYRYRVIFRIPVGVGDYLAMRLCTAGVETTVAAYYGQADYRQGGTTGTWLNGAANYLQLGYSSSGTNTGEAAIEIDNPNGGGMPSITWKSNYGAAGVTKVEGVGSWNGTAVFDGIWLYSLSGTYSGTVDVYEYQ